MNPDDIIQAAEEALKRDGVALKDVPRLILRESLSGKSYERMEGYESQHLKNEGSMLWKQLSKALGEPVKKTNFKGALENYWYRSHSQVFYYSNSQP
ncbi:MAG: serine/threonine protein kinase, partial [Cyanobacteria bacterium J06560_2]